MAKKETMYQPDPKSPYGKAEALLTKNVNEVYGLCWRANVTVIRRYCKAHGITVSVPEGGWLADWFINNSQPGKPKKPKPKKKKG